MTWEWSHTNEAYCDAYENLRDMPLEWLQVCWAEIQAAHDNGLRWEFDGEKYETELARIKAGCERLPGLGEALADDIWRWAEEARRCSNGGFELYMCPFGCHTVKPHRERE